MAEIKFDARHIHKHDTEANWLKASNFVPKQGELIVYDIDDTHSVERFKIGDGKTVVSQLPFAVTTDATLAQTGTPADAKAVGDALGEKVDKVTGKGLSTNDYTTAEKSKLEGIASGAEVNQNAFSNIVVGSTTIAADTETDTLTLVAGSNVTITPDASGDKVTIAATDTVYTHPTSGVTAGTYKSVTVNAQGHVTGGSNPTTLSGYGITDAATKTELSEVSTQVDQLSSEIVDLKSSLSTTTWTLTYEDGTTEDIEVYIK